MDGERGGSCQRKTDEKKGRETGRGEEGGGEWEEWCEREGKREGGRGETVR